MFVKVKKSPTIRPILPGKASIEMMKLICEVKTIAAEVR